jgi:hypothetical protein
MPKRSNTNVVSALLLTSGCTTFGAVRSAEVHAGPSVAVQGSFSSPVGDEAGWFWTLDCAGHCDTPVAGVEAVVTYGWPNASGGRGVAVGVGASGVYPFVDGYVQLGAGRVPFGVGGRVGLPLTSWREHQLSGRVDVPLGGGRALLLNPGLFVHEGRSPNGASRGHFVGFTQGVGLLIPGAHVDLTPAVTLVAGSARREGYGTVHGPAQSAFATASVALTLHRERTPARP